MGIIDSVYIKPWYNDVIREKLHSAEYLYKKYGEHQTIEKEVHHMVKTLYDPRIKQEGITF